jgi:hypothetical protein
MVLLALTVVVSVLTVVPGRATRLHGGVHLVLLAAFVFLAVNPERRPPRPFATQPRRTVCRCAHVGARHTVGGWAPSKP